MARRTGSGRARHQGRDRAHPLKLTVTEEERARITARAAEAGLSVASYLRAAALGHRVQAVLDHTAAVELVKVAGDQGRLGGLLKLWLTERPGQGVNVAEVRGLLARIGVLQDQLAEVVARV